MSLFCRWFLLCIFLPSFSLLAQTGKEKVTIVLIKVADATQASRCYTSMYDLKKVDLYLAADDTLFFLNDLAEEEDAIGESDCFIPRLKFIFKDYTYVVSIYCTSIIKYKNLAPYVPSATRLPNDIFFSDPLLTYLKDLQTLHFGTQPAYEQAISKSFMKGNNEAGNQLDMGELDNDENNAPVNVKEVKEAEKQMVDETEKSKLSDEDLMLEEDDSLDLEEDEEDGK